jgi:hypothetical protein
MYIRTGIPHGSGQEFFGGNVNDSRMNLTAFKE